MTPPKPTIEHARAQQVECAKHIIDGHPDQQGARLGLNDWFAEEFLLEQETTNAMEQGMSYTMEQMLADANEEAAELRQEAGE